MDAHIAACCGPTVAVWNPQAAAADNVVLTLTGARNLNVVAWMTNAKVLAAAGEEGVIRFYGTKGNNTGPVATCPKDRDISAYRNEITAMSSNQTGNSLVYGSKAGDLLVASLASLEVRLLHRGVLGKVTSIATTRSLHTAAAGTNGKVLLLADVRETGRDGGAPALAELQAPDAHPKCSLGASGLDDRIASGSSAGGVCVWDAAAARIINHCQHEGGAEAREVAVSFLPTSSDTLVAAGREMRCRVWDVRTRGACKSSADFQLQVTPTGVTCCGDGRHVAIGGSDGAVWLYDLRSTLMAAQRLDTGGDGPVKHVTWYVKAAGSQRSGSMSARASASDAHRTSAAAVDPAGGHDADGTAGRGDPATARRGASDGGGPTPRGPRRGGAAQHERAAPAASGIGASGPEPLGSPGLPGERPPVAATHAGSLLHSNGVTTPHKTALHAGSLSANADPPATPAHNTHQLKQHIDGAVEQMKDMVTNLHLDLLKQFQAQQEDLLVVTNHLTDRIDSLAADVKGIRALLEARAKQEQASNWI